MSTEAFLDARFAALPRLIRDATNPNPTVSNVREFMEALLRSDSALFEAVLQFFSRDGHGFVLVRQAGNAAGDQRTWARWPLRRLFATRRASLITNPVTQRTALAVPFCVGAERHVVVAPLIAGECDEAQRIFLETLQSAAAPTPASVAETERTPRFVWFGTNGALLKRVASVVRARGWQMISAPTFGHALVMLERDQVDVALLDAHSLPSELGSLRALRHAAKIGDAPIVYFTDAAAGSEIQTLVDYIVPTQASEGELVRVLKSTRALVFRMRLQALRARVRRMEPKLRVCVDYPELAEACAKGALAIGADAVSVMLADERGGVHAFHLPFQTVLGDHWPTPFMTGESITHTRAGEAFFRDAFDDEEYAQRLQSLHAISAAALPIFSGAHVVGTLLAFSHEQPMFQPEFDALTELCEQAGRVLLTLREPAMRTAPWRRAILGETMLEVFEGGKSRASVCTRSDENTAVVVLLEPHDDRRGFAIADRVLVEPQCDLRELVAGLMQSSQGITIGVIDAHERLRWACGGMPIPLRIPLTGPVAAARRAQAVESGVLPLDSASVTLLYSNQFAAEAEPAQIVGTVQRGLRSSRAMVAHSLPGLALHSQGVAFACITMLSSDADSPHQTGLL